MQSAAQSLAVAFVTAALGMAPQSSAAAAPPAFGDEKTSWHGFDRYDFLMDEADLSIRPHKAPPDEGNAVRSQVKGQLRCVVVAPKKAAPGNPWSWRGYYFDHEPQAEIELLKRGFHVGFIWCDAGKPWDAWYAFLTEKHALSKKPAFVGMSRGGRNAYAWATAHPGQVSCIYADNPAVSREALALLGGLAKNDVPLLHVCGSLDPILGNHTLVVESAYQQLGGRISVMIKDGAAHHPHSLRDPKPIADFIEQSQRPAGGEPPAFVGKAFTKTSFYGVASDYREIPGEKTFAACRGPWFAPSYDRYEFRIDGARMPVSVIVPKAAAPGQPWVLRADFVTRDATVDLALLGRGFHVVTGPVPTDTDGPVLQQWNAAYKHLTDHGLSKAPVLEGAGGAAGEAYAWAIENPDKVSCVYAENPILRSHMTRAQPLDRLDVLAKAGVPLLHVCGSRDPWLDTQTRVLEKRYKELGGQVTVIVQEGAGHFPTAPKDPKPVVEFIAGRQAAKAAGPPDPAPGPPRDGRADPPPVPAESPAEVARRHEAVAGRRKGTVVICHRGASEHAHENTLEAFRATFELGGDGNEFDIRATRDGVLVVFHDDMLDRLLAAYGDVGDYTWDELRRFRFRDPGRFGDQCRIPTLVEVFDLHRKYGGLIHLDIKRPGLDKAIADLLTRMGLWDHVAFCNDDNAGVLLQDPRLKLLRYKAPGLYADHADVFPDALAAALKKAGDGVIVDDPRGAAVALGRKLGKPSSDPVAPQPAPRREEAAPAAEADLIAALRDANDWDRVAETEAGRAASGRRIRARARAAEQLLARKASSKEAAAALEERVRKRSLHKDWMYQGFDGAMALRALILLRTPQAAEVARFTLWRNDPALEPVVDRRWNNPRSWADFRVKMVIFPALAKCPGAATEELCRDYLALSDGEARKLGPPLFEEAGKALLAASPRTETALELMKHRLQAVRGRAVLDCLARAGEPWARAALEKGAPDCLALRTQD